MDQRKIMALGRSSLVVSLPKRWVKLNELERGDLVTLNVQKDNSLVVFPGVKKGRETSEVTLKVDPAEDKELLTRRIIACYLNGYFGITLISTDIFTAAQQKAVRNIIGMLYMRILESDARRIYIRTLIDESKAPLETAIRRMHILAGSMCQDALKSLRNQDVELARVVHGLDDDVDHLSFVLLRLLRGAALNPDLAQELGLEPIDCLDYQTLVHRIEYVADRAVTIAKNVIMSSGRGLWLSPSVLESLLNFGNQALDMYNEAVRVFFAGDTVASNDVIERLNEIETLYQKIALSTVGVTDALTVCMMCIIRDSMKRIADCATEIAETTIDHSYKPKSPFST
ncbi:phosphate uptake regulator PhoU [Candidatus Bathyarchaeota archaeon]|nr:phosphate uptake regulator PhoU [Candidatus Bathyarchaeota archaeon]